MGLPFGPLSIPGYVRVNPSAGAEYVVEAEIRQVLYTPTTIPEGGTRTRRRSRSERAQVLAADGVPFCDVYGDEMTVTLAVTRALTPDGDRARRSNHATGFRGRDDGVAFLSGTDPDGDDDALTPRSCSRPVSRYRAETERRGADAVPGDRERHRGAAFPTT